MVIAHGIALLPAPSRGGPRVEPPLVAAAHLRGPKNLRAHFNSLNTLNSAKQQAHMMPLRTRADNTAALPAAMMPYFLINTLMLCSSSWISHGLVLCVLLKVQFAGPTRLYAASFPAICHLRFKTSLV